MPHLLSALCVGLPIVVCAASDSCAEVGAEACSTSWLQEAYSLGSRIVADAEVSRVHEAGPLTDALNAKGFSELVVPLGPGIIVATVVFLGLIAVHEACVAAGAKPLLANHEKPNSLPLQCTFALSWLSMMVSLSMLVPASLDYSLAMGQSATASGLFLSGPSLFGMLGTVAGRPLTSELNWDQRWARNLYIRCQGLVFCGNLILAFGLQAAAHWSEPAKKTGFWLFLAINAASQFFQALPIVGSTTMWNVVTPNSQKTIWSMITVCCRNSGFIVGPVLYAALSFSVRKGRDVSPVSMMGWSFLGIAFFQAVTISTSSLCLPTLVAPFEREEQEEVDDVPKNEEDVELNPEDLPPESRRQIVWNIIVYCYERPFTVAAIEVSTMMLLEVQYGWSTELCGASFMLVGAASVFATIISTVVMSRKWIKDSSLFLSSTFISLGGVLLLFDWPFFGAFGAGSLLVADSLVYAFSNVSNGIAQGWAARAAMKGTNFDIATYRVQNLAGVQISRFLAPIFTRLILDFGGRNVYAGVQLMMCILGTSTVRHTVSLVWQGKRHAAEVNNTEIMKPE